MERRRRRRRKARKQRRPQQQYGSSTAGESPDRRRTRRPALPAGAIQLLQLEAGTERWRRIELMSIPAAYLYLRELRRWQIIEEQVAKQAAEQAAAAKVPEERKAHATPRKRSTLAIRKVRALCDELEQWRAVRRAVVTIQRFVRGALSQARIAAAIKIACMIRVLERLRW